MATLTINRIIRAAVSVLGVGKDLVPANAAASDEFANDGKTFVMVANDNIAIRYVIFTTQKSILGLNVAELAVSVDASMVDGEDFMLIGPFPTNVFNDSGGKVQVTYNDQADGAGAESSSDFSIIVFSL